MHKHHAEQSLFRHIIFSRIASRIPSFLLVCGMLGAFGLIAATLSPWLTVGSLLPFGSLWIWWQPRMGEGKDTPQAGVADPGPALAPPGLQSSLSGLPILRTQLNATAEQIERGQQETGKRLAELGVGIEAMHEHLKQVQRMVEKMGSEHAELQKCTAHAVRRNQALAEETRLARVEIQYYATINQRLAHIIDAVVELEYGLSAQGAGREAGQQKGWVKRLEQRFSGCVEPWSRPVADVSRTGSAGQVQMREQRAQAEGDIELL